MHLAPLVDVVVERQDALVVAVEDLLELFHRPGEVVPVVMEAHIGVLARVEAARRRVARHLVDPMDDSLGHLLEEWLAGHLPGLHVETQ